MEDLTELQAAAMAYLKTIAEKQHWTFEGESGGEAGYIAALIYNAFIAGYECKEAEIKIPAP